MYHVYVHPLAQRLLQHIRQEELLHAGERVGIAVSGGIDSVALLRLLLELRSELGVALSVVHFNHQLRGVDSDADEKFVEHQAAEHGLEFFVGRGDAAVRAAEEHHGLEAAARELRYEFFGELIGGDVSEASRHLQVDKVVTGHTLDDQAETVLMRVIRGTGLRGLGGIHPRIVVEHEDDDGHGEIVRPLLTTRRRELLQYLHDLKQPWREDASNDDAKFTRNRLRKMVLPLLEREFNPAVAEGLSELAEIARDEEDYWANEIEGWLGTVVQWGPEPRPEQNPLVQIELGNQTTLTPSAQRAASAEHVDESHAAPVNISVSRPWLVTEPRAVQRHVIRAVGEQAGIPLEFKHVEGILHFAAEEGPTGKELSLPLRWKVIRDTEAIVFVPTASQGADAISNYEYSLSVPGRVVVPELGAAIEALQIAPESGCAEYNPQQLLRAETIGSELKVRNWRPGDRFWPAHTKAPKKIKELLQELHLPQPQRKLWPVVLSGEEIVWVRGFPVPSKLQAQENDHVVLLREVEIEGQEI
jgi:tRNA(Ile)-lysidine synthase